MKKLIAFLMIIALLLPAAVMADLPDISSLSYDELVSLRDQLNIAIWNSADWQEVEVPEGIWTVGKDIPAGHWTVKVAGSFDILNVSYYNILDDVGKSVGRGSYLFMETLATSQYSDNGHTYLESTDIDMKDGWYFECSGSVIFTPYSGKPDLGFK